MPIKIFSAPGDHRTNFQTVEEQFNEWKESTPPKNIIDIHCMVNDMPPKSNLGDFMLTMVVHYD